MIERRDFMRKAILGRAVAAATMLPVAAEVQTSRKRPASSDGSTPLRN